MLQFPREVAKRVASCKFQEKLQSVASRARACCKFRHDAGDMTQATCIITPPTPPKRSCKAYNHERVASSKRSCKACCKFQEKLQSVASRARACCKFRHDAGDMTLLAPPPEKMICVLVWEREGLMSILIYGHSNIRYLLVRLRQGGRFLHFPQLPLFPHPATTTPVLG